MNNREGKGIACITATVYFCDTLIAAGGKVYSQPFEEWIVACLVKIGYKGRYVYKKEPKTDVTIRKARSARR